MSESESSMLPLLAIGGLAIGAVVLLPSLLNKGEESVDYERAIEMARKLRQADKRREELGMYPPDRDRVPLLVGGKQEDDTYLITDDDFSKLDIGRKDRRWLNKERKIRDARLERVVYGDSSMSLPPPPMMQSFFTNTVSPYGQGPAHEFTRLGRPQDLSSTNTRTNTINLY